MVVLETDRLFLRRFVQDDVDQVLALYADPQVARFVMGGPWSRDQAVGFLERVLVGYERTGRGFWAVERRTDRCYLGHVGLLDQQVDGREELEVAYWFLPDHWGRGYATEAAAACRDHAMGSLGRSRLISLIDPDNLASRRVAERLGMHVEKETEWRDHRVVVYAIERKENS